MKSAAWYMKSYGTSYYYATLFFPKDIKNKVLALYKFVRVPDLVVDNQNTTSEAAKEELEQMWDEWEIVYNTKEYTHPVR
jgi:phytoene/squalene synthetase